MRARPVLIAFAIAAHQVLAGAGASAAEPGLGERLAREGRCKAALPELARDRRAAPDDGRLAVLEGDCQLRLGRYPEALAAFEQARALDASLPRADLGIAVAHYHLGDIEAADRALDRAEVKLPRSAEVTLYQGLVHLAEARARQSVDYLDRSRRLDAAAVEPVATYHLGLAYALEGDRVAARRELEAVVRHWAGTPWEAEARRALARLDGDGTSWWASARVGFEYDDNVVLRGDDVPLADDISGEDDVLGIWTLGGGGQLFQWGRARGGLNVSYEGTAHEDLGDFDYHYPAVGAWADWQANERTLFRGIADFGYAWVNEQPFLASWRAQLSAHHDWGSAGATHLYVEGWADNFFDSSERVTDADPDTGECPTGELVCGPAGLDERSARNRDGKAVAVGLDYSPPIPTPRWAGDWIEVPTLVTGYRFTRYDSRGQEYSFAAHQLHVTAETGWRWGLRTRAFASFTWRPYRNPTTYPNPDDVPPAGLTFDANGDLVLDDQGNPVLTGSVYPLPGGRRREREWRFEFDLSRSFWERYTVSGRYRYVDNQSTADVYDYDRHVVGVYLQVGFGG
jgi:tetratricopeptide (TPR) repeat protein